MNRTNRTRPGTPGRIKIKDDGWDITNKPEEKPKSQRVSMNSSRIFLQENLADGQGNGLMVSGFSQVQGVPVPDIY